MRSRAKRKAKTSKRRSAKLVPASAGRATRPISEDESIALTRYAAGLPLNIKQVALVIGISRTQLYKLGKEGPPYVQVRNGVKGNRRLYFPKDVEPWLRKHTANIQQNGTQNEQSR